VLRVVTKVEEVLWLDEYRLLGRFRHLISTRVFRGRNVTRKFDKMLV